jgi:2-keto-4-pentenoate hydratase/2-oxohepta-3-ene-1,7-dioic acid hydratase in catechol pathway
MLEIRRSTDDAVFDLRPVREAPRSLAEAIQLSSEALAELATLASAASRLELKAVKLQAPVAYPDRPIYCVGKNYYEHAKEFASSGFDATAKEVVPEAPVVFMKPGTSVIATGEDILGHLDDTGSVDYEGELGVVIGAGGRGIAKADAMSHVFGYTIVNDVTSRVLQNKHRQWSIGKGIDGFCPIGPAIVTAQAVPDPASLALRTFVNGELRQDARVADLIFDIPTLIATLSRYVTLRPGDIIATGTPAGVGIGFSPPKFLKANDVVRVEISGIGSIENKVA